MTHRPHDDIPTWSGRAPLRWHLSLVAGLILGLILGLLIGSVLSALLGGAL